LADDTTIMSRGTPDRSKSDVIWDPDLCAEHNFDVDSFCDKCAKKYGERLRKLGKLFGDIEHLCLEAVMRSNFDIKKSMARVDKIVSNIEENAWSDDEKSRFHNFLTSEKLLSSQTKVVGVRLRRCADEFLPKRSLRDCWRHFFDENYIEELSAATYPDLPTRRSRRIKRSRSTQVTSKYVFLTLRVDTT